ncbi:MAG: glycosyltransferase family 39 protein [Candidatus Aenigmatarchaeota archaeon]
MVNRCYFGNYDKCFQAEKALFPPGYPFLVVIAEELFGLNTLFASYISAFLSSLTIILIFLICYLLFKEEEVGLISALIFALTPISITFSHTSESRVVSIFFICLTILIYLIALNNNKIKLLTLFFLLASYTIYIRQENSILFILFFIGLFLFNYKLCFSEIKKFIIPALLFLLLQLHVQLWLLIENPFGHVEPAYQQKAFSIYYLIPQAMLYINLLFNNFYRLPKGAIFFNPIISAISVLGMLFVLEKRHRREKIFVLTWFLTYFAFYSLYLYCDVSSPSCEGHIRYSLSFTPAYSILAGYVLFRIQDPIKIKGFKITFLFLIFLILFFTSNLNVPKTFFEDQRFIYFKDFILAANKTSAKCILITSRADVLRSDVLENNHRKTIYHHSIINNDVFLTEASKSDCVLYLLEKRYENKTVFKNDFIDKNFEVSYMFTEGEIEIYSLKSKLRKSLI